MPPEGKPEEQISEEAAALAEYGRTGERPEEVPSKPERPDNVPEKFWDAEKGSVNTEALLKSYSELEKRRSTKQDAPKPEEDGDAPDDDDQSDKDDASSDDDGDKDVGDDAAGVEDVGDGPSPELSAAISSAQEAYAASGGDLPQEQRDALVAAGIPAETLDLYLAGVKAQEKALEAEVHSLAGGSDDYAAAVSWAADNWSAEEIAAYDTAIATKGMRTAVKGLMAEYREANPGEGRLTSKTTGIESGSVYESRDEFLKDLAEADKNNDTDARRKAVEKLKRSQKAGTLAHVTPRGPRVPQRRR